MKYLILYIILSETVFASCTCGDPDIYKSFNFSDHVFIGKVISTYIENHDNPMDTINLNNLRGIEYYRATFYNIEFEIIKKFKGELESNKTKVKSRLGYQNCGASFINDSIYMVFCNFDDYAGNFGISDSQKTTALCYPNAIINYNYFSLINDLEDLEYLFYNHTWFKRYNPDIQKDNPIIDNEKDTIKQLTEIPTYIPKEVKIDSNSIYYLNEGFLNIFAKEYEDALINFRKSIELDKIQTKAFLGLGLAYNNLDDPLNAEIAFISMLESDLNYAQKFLVKDEIKKYLKSPRISELVQKFINNSIIYKDFKI